MRDQLSFVELKKLGAPFDAVEVHVSRHAGAAKLVVVVGAPGEMPGVELRIEDGESVEMIGEEIILAAKESGLLHAKSRYVVIDLDALEAAAATA